MPVACNSRFWELRQENCKSELKQGNLVRSHLKNRLGWHRAKFWVRSPAPYPRAKRREARYGQGNGHSVGKGHHQRAMAASTLCLAPPAHEGGLRGVALLAP